MNTPIRHRGLTLVEACMAMAVLAIIVTLAIPSFADLLARRRLLGWADLVATDMRQAHAEAVKRNRRVMARFPTPGCYVLHVDPAPDCACKPGCSDRALIKQVDLDRSAGIDLAANVRSISFEPNGTVVPSGSLTLSNGRGDTLRHRINVLGRLRTCAVSGHLPHPAC